MKYIKQFNEELNPSTYRNAAKGFRQYGNTEKSNKLSDFANELEFGKYNIIINDDSSNTTFPLEFEFTNPVITNIYYGDNNYKNEEELVNSWIEGSDECVELDLYIEFGFALSNKNNQKESSLLPRSFTHKSGETYTSSDYIPLCDEYTLANTIPIFTIRVKIADANEYEVPVDAIELYNKTKNIQLSLAKPFGSEPDVSAEWFGLFADRKSALTFKKRLPSLINDNIKSRIMDILSLVGADVSDYESIIKYFENIRVNGLYNNVKSRYRIISYEWYYKDLCNKMMTSIFF